MGISDDGIRLTLRLPEKLRNKIAKRARQNFRSLNSEIVNILENADFVSSNSVNENVASYAGSSSGKTNRELAQTCEELPEHYAQALLPVVKLLGNKKR